MKLIRVSFQKRGGGIAGAARRLGRRVGRTRVGRALGVGRLFRRGEAGR